MTFCNIANGGGGVAPAAQLTFIAGYPAPAANPVDQAKRVRFRDALLENVDLTQNRIGIAQQIYEHFTRIALEGVAVHRAVSFSSWTSV